MWPYLSFSGYKTQYTIESLNDKNERQEIKESEIMKDAIIQLLKITVFIVRKHWARTASYEDLVCFIGNDLGNSVLKEYLTLTDSHKNATYITANRVKQFIKIISEWMKKNTVNELKTCNEFTLLLDESTDEANRSELSLIVRMIKDGKIENHFLDLLQLNRGDTETIFECLRLLTRKWVGYQTYQICRHGWMLYYGWWTRWIEAVVSSSNLPLCVHSLPKPSIGTLLCPFNPKISRFWKFWQPFA